MELKNLFFFVFFPELSEIFAKVTMLRKYNQCEYEEQFVTITSLGINDKVSVMDASKKLTSDVDLDTVVDEIQAEAVKDSFWNTIMIAPDKTNLTDK